MRQGRVETWPVPRPTTRSAIVVSSVSPDLCVGGGQGGGSSLGAGEGRGPPGGDHAATVYVWGLRAETNLCETMTPQPPSCAMLQALMDSVTVPIWFTLSSRPEQAFFSLAVCSRTHRV